jgi:hypothetical protein
MLLTLCACGPPAIRGGFDSDNPAAKMYAIEYAARAGDHDAVEHIIRQLDSDDPAVRMLAIGALERLTGETHGYRHFDHPLERRKAIRRWVAWTQGDASDAIGSEQRSQIGGREPDGAARRPPISGHSTGACADDR